MTAGNVMGKASGLAAKKGGLVLGAGLSDAGPVLLCVLYHLLLGAQWSLRSVPHRRGLPSRFARLGQPAPCLLRLAWKRHQAASGRLEWRGGTFGLAWIHAMAMRWAGLPHMGLLSPGPDYSGITKHACTPACTALHCTASATSRLPPPASLVLGTRRSWAIAFRQSYYSAGVQPKYLPKGCIDYSLSASAPSPPCTPTPPVMHAHTHSRSPLHVTSDAPCFP
ncbi:hypothetical protein COCC4DRAFT_22192 [Bipolaris maydis ATCC 48331]|uniref:Uncharacterized protein n=2 Tax=Cochliobolus heterostrophus TaxID=5016 RepID=M2UHJ9_COCH5|nr:uncharacterized protein COCC4DRAFT_22192 [Bipolaris maydis ATCC 48331]EMD87468.1 hypothetical protein COCHEDRAFT_1033881 [Bipolaris maydis C5]ENI06667.1 hypothetical protein COCC4DRAFT_22192 [Bipolaris maydis ATCC 48331]KAJ6212128.1 hypothetical protein PSV09DRAFT_1033881 [Bipolaris maydis]